MTVEKKTITPQVNVGDDAIFEIVVTNTGDVNLENVFVCESEYDSGLVYLDYVSKVGTWKHSTDKEGRHVFTLQEVLEVEDFASFRVIFKTTKAGNFSNTVTAGYNDTTVTNATNTTEVIGENPPDTPENKTDVNISVSINKTIDIKTDNKTDTGNTTEKDIADDERKAVSKTEIDEKATGNPLMILIMALILIPLRRFKK